MLYSDLCDHKHYFVHVNTLGCSMQLINRCCNVLVTSTIVNCCLCCQVSKTVVDMQIEVNRLREEIEASKFEMTNKILQMEISLAETEEEKKRLIRVAAAAKDKLEVAEKSQKEMADELARFKNNNVSLAAAHQKEVSISSISFICFTFICKYVWEKYIVTQCQLSDFLSTFYF